MGTVYMQKKTKRPTMRDNLAGNHREVQTSPGFVAGEDRTPAALGERDDFAWAIADELTKFLYDEGINSKGAAYYFKVGQDALDRSKVRRMYKEDPARFRNGDGKQLTLGEFGRSMVRYFRKNADWQFCNSVEEVVHMFYDPVTLDVCAKGLWRVYRDRRIRKGIS